MFSYELHKGRINVRVGRRVAGWIKKVPGGYQYWPGGVKKHADPNDVRETVAEVKAIIEGD